MTLPLSLLASKADTAPAKLAQVLPADWAAHDAIAHGEFTEAWDGSEGVRFLYASPDEMRRAKTICPASPHGATG